MSEGWREDFWTGLVVTVVVVAVVVVVVIVIVAGCSVKPRGSFSFYRGILVKFEIRKSMDPSPKDGFSIANHYQCVVLLLLLLL